MMRILATIIAPPHLSVSGGARAGEQLSVALASLGSIDVTVANMIGEPAGRPNPRPSRLPVTTTLPFPIGRLRSAKRLRALFYKSDIPHTIKRGNFDLVHIHNPMPALEMARVARACRSAGVPYVVSTHGFNEIANGRKIYGFGLAGRLAWWLLAERPVREAVRKASGIFALSAADFAIVEQMGVPRDRISIVSNGVATPVPADQGEDRSIYRRLELSVPKESRAITCMFLANHTPNKGLPDLFAAFAALKRPYQLIVGGEKRDGIDYASAARSCGPNQSIVVTGALQDKEVSALFRYADIFVFPTLADTFPLAVLEAMVNGLPIVASCVGGIPHQLGEDAGILVEPGRPDELAAAIEALANDPNRRLAMGQCARHRALKLFTWEGAARNAQAGYHEAISRFLDRKESAPRPLASLNVSLQHEDE